MNPEFTLSGNYQLILLISFPAGATHHRCIGCKHEYCEWESGGDMFGALFLITLNTLKWISGHS